MNTDRNIRELARLVAQADSALTAATIGRGVDSHQQPLPNIDRNVHQALLDLQRAGALASDVLLRMRGGAAVIAGLLLLGAIDANASSRTRRDDWRPAVLTLSASESASQANVARLRQPLVGGCLGTEQTISLGS